MRNARPPSVPAAGRQAVGAAAQPVAGTAPPATDAEVIGRSRADPELFAAIFDRRLSDIASDATYDMVRKRRRSGAT